MHLYGSLKLKICIIHILSTNMHNINYWGSFFDFIDDTLYKKYPTKRVV